MQQNSVTGVLALHTCVLCVIRYIIHLWDMRQDGLWENRNTYTYYAACAGALLSQ